MIRLFFVFLFALAAFTSVSAQRYLTRTGKVSFFSETAIENIEAHSNQLTSVLDTESGQIQFEVLIKGFHFEKALMEEHFNENYMESDKYPKGTFKGKITDLSKVNFKADGEYPVKVSGDMTIHGVTKPMETDGVITVSGGVPSAASTFKVLLADYGIKIPAVVTGNISKEIEIKVDVKYEPWK